MMEMTGITELTRNDRDTDLTVKEWRVDFMWILDVFSQECMEFG
jgi:hypothetical protein